MDFKTAWRHLREPQTVEDTETPGPLLRLVKDQRIAFLVVGGFNTLLGFSLFVVFQLLVGDSLGYIYALLFSHLSSVLIAYIFQRTLVFRVKGHWLLDLARFEVVQLSTVGINFIFLPLLVELLGLTPIFAQGIISLFTVTLSWFGHKYFSFRRKRRLP